MSEEQK
jgi:hypothetical protein